MCLSPIKESQLELGHSWQKVRVCVSLYSKLFSHFLYDILDSFVTFMALVGHMKVQFTVLFYFNADVIKAFDRSVACKEVLGTRAECNDLKVLEADDGSCNWNEFHYHGCNRLCVSHRIFRYIVGNLSQIKVIGAVEHSTVCISSTVNKIVACFFCCCSEHYWAWEVFGNKCLRCFRTEIA